jgi:rfaE bifunctional protein nucleotidyltransferase chain/domain
MDYRQQIESRILTEDELERKLAYWRFRSYSIVFTNGCFDVLHAGHVDYLAQAASFGDILVIGVNTDDSVRRLKGNARPVNHQQARALVLAGLRFVDAVVFFKQDTPLELIRRIQPDILVKGSDYKAEEIVGYDVVMAKGGSVVTVELTEGFSSTSIIERLKNI